MRELSLNVMDVAQNSVTANASLITIIVNESKKDDFLDILIDDNGKGMTKEQVEHVTDPFFTTRTTRKVGLGVPLFKMAAEQTGGTFEISSTLSVGTVLKAHFVPSSVDMTPLGDINSTVSILIRCNPKIDFVFKHKTDKGEFSLDTRQLKQVLGEDVSIDTPDVIAWIDEFLYEQTQIIYGGATP